MHENEISGEIVDAACRIHRRIGPRVVWIRLRADSAIRDRATRTTNAVCAWRRPHGGRTSRPRIARITRIKTGIRAFCDPWNPWCRVRSFSTTDCTNNTDQDRNPGLVLGDQLVLPYPGDTLVWSASGIIWGRLPPADRLDAVTLLIGRAHNLHVVARNFYEFWVVATRPANVNGPGKTAAEALADLVYFEGLFHWLDETVPIYSAWKDLVTSTPILGKNGRDARFVTAMAVHGLTHLLTFNTQDFRQYPAITAVAPADVLASRPRGPRGSDVVTRIGTTTG